MGLPTKWHASRIHFREGAMCMYMRSTYRCTSEGTRPYSAPPKPNPGHPCCSSSRVKGPSPERRREERRERERGTRRQGVSDMGCICIPLTRRSPPPRYAYAVNMHTMGRCKVYVHMTSAHSLPDLLPPTYLPTYFYLLTYLPTSSYLLIPTLTDSYLLIPMDLLL